MTSPQTTPTIAPAALDPELAEAYSACADKNLLAALNPKIFFGYFSVCADPRQGHGHDTTYPGLDWGQSAEALMWLGRRKEVLASWDYVKSFVRADGLLPIAIFPSKAGVSEHVRLPTFKKSYPITFDANGGLYQHWFPGNPLLLLPNVTFVILADSIFEQTADKGWLANQIAAIRIVADWIVRQISPEGLVPGAGFYIERPTRQEYDGITQCYTVHALRLAHKLTGHSGYAAAAARITSAFQHRFWAGAHCVEYINQAHGAIAHHGFTDVDWASIATDVATVSQRAALWPQLRDNPDFLYAGIPTGIATRPETYDDWEMMYLDRHDLAAMGRVWYLEAWARFRMGDREGILESLRKVARIGRANGWSWRERYYSSRTGDLGSYTINTYCEYPATFIRIVHRFVLGQSPASP